MKIQITHSDKEVKYKNILILDLYTFSTTASILFQKNPNNLYTISWENNEAFIVQNILNNKKKSYLLIDDSLSQIDENNIRINSHPIPIYYKNKISWKKYSSYNIIYRSQNWTQSIHKNYKSNRNILIWSLVNFNSTIKYIKENFSEITLFVCWTLWEINSDDLMCAKYYKYILEGNIDEDKKYYLKLIKEMINSNWKWDFFIRYFNSRYWDILWFNLKLDLAPWVIKAEKKILWNKHVYKLYKVKF